MLQGVLARGTAHALSGLSAYVAGKTGTTESENDGWFIGFTNDVTVAVWVGYDNADGKRRTLGSGQTGASVAIPIFEPIIQAVWSDYAPKSPLAPPSVAVKQEVVAQAIDLASGNVLSARSGKGFVEYFRRDSGGEPYDTQYDLVSRDEAYSAREYRDDQYGQDYPPYGSYGSNGGYYQGGGSYGGGYYPSPAPPLRDPWRAQPPGYYQQQAPQRRDVYTQPPPQPQAPRNGNGFFFWNWR
jgi:membrane peptidoglycan carboxypeptidase